ncbi:cell envelope integrity EipB family protein [Radicibacter daui]|uniref:cell envelope integrity EipB family protein n=1 Tax=Radicibacter daui TaxID=3064829 RepID=UPI004046D456
MPPASANVVPHRALYDITLARSSSNSQVTAASGKMSFEWADACDGWITNQRYDLAYSYRDGDDVQIRNDFVSWESKDGNRLQFHVRKLVNGDLDEAIEGTAERSGGQMVAHFTQPEEKDIPLAADTLFPTAHTLQLMQAVGHGPSLLFRKLFDGSDMDSGVSVNAVISRAPRGGSAEEAADKLPTQKTADGKEGKKAIDARLLASPAKSVSLAFFAPDGGDASPEYEMSFDLHENGVASDMLMNYGDYVLSARLLALEPLPSGGC